MNQIIHIPCSARRDFSRHTALAVILIFISTPLAAASFNCWKASTQAENMICADPELSQADEEMADAYQKLLKALPKSERALLKRDQRQWLKERDIEFRTCEYSSCHAFYLVRIGLLSPVSPAGFNCKKAISEPEKKICRSRLLRHADGRMTDIYQNFSFSVQEQREWLKSRDRKLRRSYCDTECAWQLYKERIEEFLVNVNYDW